MNKVVSLIPARGGSKGIPRKNLAMLNGKPLIAYSIEYSLKCNDIERTIVSTDDEEIAEIALKYGAEVPFMRPSEFAQDDSTDFEVFNHAIEWFNENEKHVPEFFVQLRPTSPLRPKNLVANALKLIEKHPVSDCLRTMTEAPITPYKMWVENGRFMNPFAKLEGKESFNMPRQDLPKVYWHDGVLDIVKSKTVIEKKSVNGDNILPYYMDDPMYSIDIDTYISLKLTEVILNQNIENGYDQS